MFIIEIYEYEEEGYKFWEIQERHNNLFTAIKRLLYLRKEKSWKTYRIALDLT